MDAAQVTLVLQRVADGDREAAEQLLPFVYDELKRMANVAMGGQSKAHTLQPTALVHEAYVRLIRPEEGYQNRSHFMAVASMAMRQILTDHARRKRAARRGGDMGRVSADSIQLEGPGNDEVDVVALDDALTKLAELDPRRHRVVELRFFGGLSVEDVAALLGISRSTVEADWRGARAWLAAELADAG